MFDVVVIGGGLAGVTAAMAARAQGAKVGLARRSWGATATSTGALDLAYTPALSATHVTPRTLAEHIMDIAAHRKRHPYGVLGVEKTLQGLGAGYGWLESSLAGTGLDLPALDLEAENRSLPSGLGTLIPAGAAMAPHWGAQVERLTPGPWGVVGFTADPSFDPERVAAGIRHDADRLGVEPPDLVPLWAPGEGPGPFGLARSFDDVGAVERLGDWLVEKARDLAGVLISPVLGLEEYAQSMGVLSSRLGIPVVEALGRMPSVPGWRLQRRLERILEASGVAAVGEVTEPVIDQGRVAGLLTPDRLDIRAGAFVLATGRFTAGGIVWDSRCREALFELPVVSELGPLEEDSPHNVVRESPTESHPLMTAGVWVNSELKAMNEGKPAFANLFAAGNVLGGFASRYTLCSDGVALATGWMAGQAAALEAGGT